MAVDTLGPKEFVGFGPGGDQREAKNVFVEGSGGLLIFRDICSVVQTLSLRHRPSLSDRQAKKPLAEAELGDR